MMTVYLYKKQQIANLIGKSFALKKQSEHLLEVAKTAVEMAIEQNEEVAMEYLKSRLIKRIHKRYNCKHSKKIASILEYS